MLSRSEKETEQRLLAALSRLEVGDITSPALLKRREAGKKISINYTNVALEAGRSPALIGTPESRYTAVRNKIRARLEQKADAGPKSRDPKEVIRSLRAQIAGLEADIRVLATRLNDAISVARVAEARLEQEASRNRRVAARKATP